MKHPKQIFITEENSEMLWKQHLFRISYSHPEPHYSQVPGFSLQSGGICVSFTSMHALRLTYPEILGLRHFT